MLEKKECFMEKLFLATLWAKLLIITVNFGNKTKDFSENFGWQLPTEAQVKHLTRTRVHNSLKAESKVKEASRWPLEHHAVAVDY